MQALSGAGYFHIELLVDSSDRPRAKTAGHHRKQIYRLSLTNLLVKTYPMIRKTHAAQNVHEIPRRKPPPRVPQPFVAFGQKFSGRFRKLTLPKIFDHDNGVSRQPGTVLQNR